MRDRTRVDEPMIEAEAPANSQRMTFGQAVFDTVRLDEAVLPALVYPSSNPGLWGGRRVRFSMSVALVVLLFLTVVLGDGPDWLRLVAAGGCIAVLPIILLATRKDLGRLALSTGGIHMGPTSGIFVPWDAIESVRVDRWMLMMTAFIRIADHDAVRVSASIKPFLRLSPLLISSEMAAATGNSGRSREFAAVLDHYLRHPEDREEIGLQWPARLEEPRPNEQPRWKQVAGTVTKAMWFALMLFCLLLFVVYGLERL